MKKFDWHVKDKIVEICHYTASQSIIADEMNFDGCPLRGRLESTAVNAVAVR